MLGKVEFRPEDYGADIARILGLNGGGKRLMPLVKTGSVSTHAGEDVKSLGSLPNSVLSGLYLYCNCWDEAHSAADSVEDPNGYFWHAIVHRQEPDSGNAGYWFRKTGKHPIFLQLAEEVEKIGYRGGREWDPFAFVEFCEMARTGSADEQLSAQAEGSVVRVHQIATRVQLVEWQLLFDHCARGQIR
jgi:hypothetical protein